MAEITDDELIERIRADDSVAFEILYRTHISALWGFARQFVHSHDIALDLVQDIFSSIWIGRTVWSPRPPIRAYLYRAVKNRCISEIRHDAIVQKAEGTMENSNQIPGFSQSPESPYEDILVRDRQLALRRELDSLPDRQRIAFLLWWKDDLKAADIARILDISPESARRLLIKAQSKLLRLLKEL